MTPIEIHEVLQDGRTYYTVTDDGGVWAEMLASREMAEKIAARRRIVAKQVAARRRNRRVTP